MTSLAIFIGVTIYLNMSYQLDFASLVNKEIEDMTDYNIDKDNVDIEIDTEIDNKIDAESEIITKGE